MHFKIVSCVIVLLNFITHIISGQTIDPTDKANTVQDQNKAFIRQVTANPLQKAGKYFINDQFVIANFNTKDGRFHNNIPSRYDIYLHHFEVVIKSANFRLLANQIDSFNFYDTKIFKKRHFVNIDLYGQETDYKGFLETLLSDSSSLFKLKAVSYYKGTESPSVITGGGEEKIKVFEYFFFSKGNRIFRLKGSKKSILKNFSPCELKILEFVKTKKLSFKKEKDLISIVTYYNTLLKSHENY